MQDPILLWNEVALEANRVDHTNGRRERAGPTLSSRALAIVHLAMYDAYVHVVGVNNSRRPYIAINPAPPPVTDPAQVDAAVAAAVATAAYKTLSELYPSQQSLFELMFSAAGAKNNDAGYMIGKSAAANILAARGNDPKAESVGHVLGKDRSSHRPDPDNYDQELHAPFYGARSNGFAISTRFELAPPPFGNGTAAEYKAALEEVRGKGIKPELMGSLPSRIQSRSSDETVIGLFWGYDGAAQLGTPPRLYNQIVRRVAIAKPNGVTGKPNGVEENARLFALVNVAMADAGILAWQQKYHHDFWRPVVGIREHGESLGPKATATSAHNAVADDCDPLWLPLGAPNTNRIGKNSTPPFPAYPSGHATFGAAALHMTRLCYGEGGRYNGGGPNSQYKIDIDNGVVTLGSDNLFAGLDFVSDELNGISTDNTGAVRPKHLRHFPDGGLWQMIEENGRSRVYLGVHWVFDAFQVKGQNRTMDLERLSEAGLPYGGVPLGLLIAENIFDAFEVKSNAAWLTSLPPNSTSSRTARARKRGTAP